MTFAKDERAGLCELLSEVGPDAPTLCGDWTTHDLAAHLWIRETDPVGAPGILAKPLAGLTERRMAEAKSRWSYAELVERVGNGPARFSVFSFPGVDEPANTTEFFIHHEDVRRAGDHPAGPRDLGDEVEDWMWRRLKLLGRAFFRRAPVGVVLERTPLAGSGDGDSDGEPETIRAQNGTRIVTVVGKPSELVIFANGRTGVADVKLVGEQDAIDALLTTDLSV
ncbi:TIGR03085 family metal-binding protein [Microlunatus soli]|uniref:TIGR03085 family protein n=1 Tax=Microlunatus soli TaxID=630515 RepID=A0A1H2A3A6_9ACTN|nr:TIGR03085 family metal-binding protein [Microlunatus soli]SDT40445.1 TIGR03085 family protein [Microlunatus soli]